MSINKYQPKYPVGYEYKVGNTNYYIDKIENGMYYERCSSIAGYMVTRCDVFDANHKLDRTSISLGIGLEPHSETQGKNESA
tara:strand:- start:206 stop:451 length:246 start_codon:yes stop_codon:yes gene_type:complete